MTALLPPKYYTLLVGPTSLEVNHQIAQMLMLAHFITAIVVHHIIKPTFPWLRHLLGQSPSNRMFKQDGQNNIASSAHLLQILPELQERRQSHNIETVTQL